MLPSKIPSVIVQTYVAGLINNIRVSLLQLQNVLQISGAIVDLIDVQGSSVMVCLEDGWDFTTQVKLMETSDIIPKWQSLNKSVPGVKLSYTFWIRKKDSKPHLPPYSQ